MKVTLPFTVPRIATALPEFPERKLRNSEVTRPRRPEAITIGGAPARQIDETSCGAAALLMLATLGDSVLGEWFDSGVMPPSIRALPPEVPPAMLARPTTAQERFTAAQRLIRSKTRSNAFGPLPWPEWYGTPPWTAARVARFPGVRFEARPVIRGRVAGQALDAAVLAAVDAGYPVLLYTGGNLSQGLTRAVPRHVILALPSTSRRFVAGGRLISLYEPTSGTVFEVPAADLVTPDGPYPAFGYWSHIHWVVYPIPTKENQ